MGGEVTEESVLKPEAEYMANPNFLMREIGGDCVLVPVGEAGIFDNCVLSLNSTSRFLWSLFQTPATLQEAVRKCAEQFDAPPEVIEKDVRDFIIAYLNVNLLQEGK